MMIYSMTMKWRDVILLLYAMRSSNSSAISLTKPKIFYFLFIDWWTPEIMLEEDFHIYRIKSFSYTSAWHMCLFTEIYNEQYTPLNKLANSKIKDHNWLIIVIISQYDIIIMRIWYHNNNYSTNKVDTYTNWFVPKTHNAHLRWVCLCSFFDRSIVRSIDRSINWLIGLSLAHGAYNNQYM